MKSPCRLGAPLFGIALSLIASAQAGCRSCTDADCSSNISVALIGMRARHPGRQEVQVCANGLCASWFFDTAAEACSPAADPRFPCSFYADRDELLVGLPISADLVHVETRLDPADGGTALYSASNDVATHDDRPNGPSCEPVCQTATLWLQL